MAKGPPRGGAAQTLTTSSSVLVLLGHRGDKPRPPDPGLHVHLQRNNQRERQGGAEDVLCKHRNVTVPFPEQPGVLKSCLHWGKKTDCIWGEGTTHFLTANFCPSFLMCVLCSVLWGLFRLVPMTLVAFRLVCDVCPDRSATCTVLTPKQKEEECVLQEKRVRRTHEDGDVK